MRWLKYIMILLIGSLCVGSIPIQASAESKVQLQVEPGWNGEYKGEFVPVKVRITNLGGDVEGQLMVQQPKPSQHEPIDSTVQKETIKVPAGSTKEVVLYLPEKSAIPNTKILWMENNNVVHSVKVGGRQLGATDLAMGYMSDNPNDASVWNQMFTSNSQVRVYTYPFKAKDIPIQARGLSGLDVIVVNHFTTENLSQKQIEALQLWVANGGKLVISANNSTELLQGFASLLPVEEIKSGTQLKNLQSLSQWGAPPVGQVEVKESKLKKGSGALLKVEDTPLISLQKFDKGKIYFASYDLLAEPMKNWPNHQKVWSEQLISLDMQMNMHEMEMIPNGEELLNQSFAYFSNYPSPSIVVIIIVFLIYLILGPIIYWVLSRKRKHEWMWAAVPLLSIIFASGLLIYGQIIHGKDVLVNTVGYVDLENGEVATVRAASALISQEEDNYSIISDNGFIWNQKIEVFSPNPNTETTVSFQEKPKITFLNVPQWGMRSLYTESVNKVNGTLTGSVQIMDQGSKGTVTNQTDFLIEDVHVAVGDQKIKIGNLKPGESKPFSSNKPFQMLPSNSFDPDITRMSLKGMLAASEKRVISSLSEVDVYGFTRANLMKLEVENQGVDQSSLFLINGKLDLQPLSDATIKAPHGLVDATILHSTVPYHVGFMGEMYTENSGAFTFEFDLSEWNIKELQELSVLDSRGDSEVYDWVQHQWVSSKTPNLEKIALSPDQRIQVRVDVEANTEIIKPTIQVRGRVK